MKATGLFPATRRENGVKIEAGGRYLDSSGAKWRATETTTKFSDGLYRACVCCAGESEYGAAYFRAADGAPFGNPTAARLIERL